MIDTAAIRDEVSSSGFTIVADALTHEDLDSLAADIDAASEGARAGIRNLFQCAASVRSLPRHPAIRSIVKAILGRGAFAVRAILFDKAPESNWNVPWHQDVTIAVAQQTGVDGYGAWSNKDGVPHVQPPVAVLEQMLAVRVHVDDCGQQNGPLRVLPGSHRHGRLDRAAVEDWQRRVSPLLCHVPRGGLVVMRPLLLHSSLAAEAAHRRRVIHLEFAATELEPPLTWHECVF